MESFLTGAYCNYGLASTVALARSLIGGLEDADTLARLVAVEEQGRVAQGGERLFSDQ